MRRYLPLLLILLFALAIRLVHIDYPTIGAHQWRQSQTAMVSLNFHENGYNFMYPQIDWVGGDPGYAETEFPLYSYLVALGYGAFGDNHWVGRLTSVVFSILTIVFMYLLARRLIDEKAALWSAFVLSILPLFAFYGRALMPEPLMLMSTAAGVYYFSGWLRSEKARDFVLAYLFISIACLIKPTSLYLGLPLLYLSLLKYGARDVLKKWPLWFFSALVVGTTFAWYYHAHNIFKETGHTIGLYDKWLNWALLAKAKFWDRVIVKSLLERHFAWSGFVVLIAGLFMKRRTKEEMVFDFWLLAVFIYMLIAGQGNMVHDYYQLPFILPGAVIIGKVFSRRLDFRNLKERTSALLAFALAGMVVMSFVQYFKFMKKEEIGESATYRVAEKARELTSRDSLLLTITEGDPSVLYLSHREGWIAGVNDTTPEYLDDKLKNGLKYVASMHWRYEKEENRKKLDGLMGSGRFKAVYDDGVVFILEAVQK